MFKKFEILMLFSFFLLAGCAGMKTMSHGSASQTPLAHLAILPFESSNPYLPGNAFSDYFTVFVHRNIGEFQIIDRRAAANAFENKKINSKNGSFSETSSPFDDNDPEIDAVMVGSVQTLDTIQSQGGTISVTVKIIEVSSKKVLWADKEIIGSVDWPALKSVEEVAENLIKKSAQKMVRRIKKDFDSQPLHPLETVRSYPVFHEVRLELPHQ